MKMNVHQKIYPILGYIEYRDYIEGVANQVTRQLIQKDKTLSETFDV